MAEMSAAERNDTLNGLLLQHERKEEMHLRNKFGYWRMVEKRMLREQLIAEGVTDETELHFAIIRRVEQNHKNDITYKESSAAFSAGAKVRPSTDFTREELEFLRDHFAMANDPTAVAILAKVCDKLA